MDLNQWCKTAEDLVVTLANEKYNLYDGLDYDKALIDQTSAKLSKHSKLFLKNFKEPRLLVMNSVAEVADAECLPHDMKIITTRNEKFVVPEYKFRGKTVTWNNVNQFFQTMPDDRTRKEVTDTLISKVPLITPHIRNFLETGKKVYERYDASILGDYLEEEGLSLERLKALVEDIGTRLGGLYKKSSNEFRDLLGKPIEYYDSYTYIHAVLFKDLNKFVKMDPVASVQKTLKTMGLKSRNISIDGEYRENKVPVAWCFAVKVPEDVRMAYVKTTPIRDLEIVYHEYGHCIHAAVVRPELPYWTRYLVPTGVSETFSTLLENLTYNHLYMQQFMSKDNAIELEERKKLLLKFARVGLCARASLKISYWERGLTMEQMDNLNAKLFKRFMDMEIPGSSWQLNHILPESLIYMPSYLIAEIRVAELQKVLMDRFGEKWWKEKGAGDELKRLMSAGADIDLGFSKLDPKPLIKSFL